MKVTTPDAPAVGSAAAERPNPWRWVVLAIMLLFAAFWVWALFFASKESINRIGDDAWAERAQGVCEVAGAEREALADFREVKDDDPSMVAERGVIIDKATDILERMVDDIVAIGPADPKGQELVPQWEADYRTYIADRRAFAEQLRAGVNEPFGETVTDEQIPISAKLSRFAGDNHMAACSPPTDLS